MWYLVSWTVWIFLSVFHNSPLPPFPSLRGIKPFSLTYYYKLGWLSQQASQPASFCLPSCTPSPFLSHSFFFFFFFSFFHPTMLSQVYVMAATQASSGCSHNSRLAGCGDGCAGRAEVANPALLVETLRALMTKLNQAIYSFCSILVVDMCIGICKQAGRQAAG